MTLTITCPHGLDADLIVLTTSGKSKDSLMRSVYRRIRTTSLRPAFTMVEMVVVVVISGLMVVLAIPRIDTTKIKADAIATIVRTTLQYAQRQAITRQHDMVVSFDTTGERIRTFWDADNSGTITGTEHVTWRGLDVGILFTDPAVNGVFGNRHPLPCERREHRHAHGIPHSHVSSRRLGQHRRRDLHQGTGARSAVVPRDHADAVDRRVDWYRLNAQAGKWIQANQ